MKTIEDSILTISHAKFSAKILFQGAQIIEFTLKDGKNIFWHVNMEHFHMQKPFRGGVPICWPWFGKSASPSHGFARISEWTLAEYSESDEGVYMVFTLNDSEATRALWNHAFGLRLEMRLGERCDLMLHIDADVPTTGALHSYFAVQNIEECSIEGLGGSYYDSLSDSKLTKEESRHVKITAETDRIYNRPEPLNTINRGIHERIIIKHHGASDVVLWNPWYEGAEAFWDMESADASKMLCVESARINKPFEPQSTLGVSIEVSREHKR